MVEFTHSHLEDLAKKGYKPRVVNGRVVTRVATPVDFVPVKKKSVETRVKAEEDKVKA